MSGYADVDGVIAAWVRSAKSKLFTEWADAPARFFYVPGDPPFECFQVSVSVPTEGRTSVTARAVDTNDGADDQMEETWEGPIVDLDQLLRAAMATIEKWKARERTRPDLPSPW
jgi:hypothetical protein